ncbi:MAG: tandem-95 repeat protein, partial [Bacteroidetes bacterium]|nr:tandem-95 repeat protein [Bacteroidota bacterium]
MLRKITLYKKSSTKITHFNLFRIRPLALFLVLIFLINTAVFSNSSGNFTNNEAVSFLENTAVLIPSAKDDSFIMYQNTTLTGNIFNDNGAGADDLGSPVAHLSNISFPFFGTLGINSSGNFTYTPFPGFYGVDSFTYTLSDGLGNFSTATVTIIVIQVPIARADTFTAPEEVILNGNVLANNGNGSDQLGIEPTTVTAYTQPSNGSVVVNPDGSFTYTPNTDFNGTDTFTYTITDSNGNSSTATVTVTVTPVNDPPIITSISTYTTPEDTPLTQTATASDIDGDALTFSITVNPSQGSVVINPTTGVWTYTPNPDYNG